MPKILVLGLLVAPLTTTQILTETVIATLEVPLAQIWLWLKTVISKHDFWLQILTASFNFKL